MVISRLAHDFRFALRLIRRQPLLTAAAVVTIALGVGANTAVVSVLETVLLNPLGLRGADRVVVPSVTLQKLQMFRSETSAVEYREIREMRDAFSAVTAMEGRYWTSVVNGAPARVIGRAVTPEFFQVFGESPALGRFFAPEDREAVVLSYGFWQSQFGGDAGVLQRVVVLDDQPHRVIGVAPKGFRFPATAQAWTPLLLTERRMHRRGYNMNLTLVARLRDGITPAQAKDRVNRYVEGMLSEPGNRESKDLGYRIEVDGFATYIAGDLRRPLLLLWAAAAILLVTCCANVAGLLLSRAASRRKEIAVRISLGASRSQILRQLLMESAALGALGGIGGLAVASVAVSMLTRLAIPTRKILTLVTLDRRLLLYGLGLALLSGLIFGLAPAIQLLRDSQTTAMVRSGRRRFQGVFVTAEVAGAFLLLVATGLLLRSLWAVEQVRPGFDPRGVTTVDYMKPKTDPGFDERLRAQLRSSPGIDKAALAYPVPFSGGGLTSGFNIRNRHRRPGEPEWHGEAYMVSPGYLETLRIPLLRGRDLADSDSATAPLVCLIDSRTAERFFPNQDPMGQEIAMYKGWARIVGITGTIRATTLESDSRPVVYYSLAQMPFWAQTAVVVRSAVPVGGIIREAMRRTNGSAPLFDMKSMEERIDESLGIRRIVVTLLTCFGVITLLLATVGLYGVVAQMVGERIREIGIRMALGARPRDILSHFLRLGLQMGAAGLVIGLAAAVFAQRWLKDMLYQIQPFDPSTYCLAGAGLILLLAAAVSWPSRKAAHIDPQEALRYE